MKPKKSRVLFLMALLMTAGVAGSILLWHSEKEASEVYSEEESKFGIEEPGKIEQKIERAEYFFRLLRDPATNSIPPDIRRRELNHARSLPDRSRFPMRLKQRNGTLASVQFSWESAGPFDVGGRTRALGIDRRNRGTIIAGGASGGIWKSTDGGTTWDLKTDPSQHLSVTSLAQDPTSFDTWYYTSGEFRGNTAADRSGRAPYFGTGVYKSSDNGETWSIIPETADNDTDFNSPYDFITRVVVSPTTGSVFIASNGIGIYRSTDPNTDPFPSDSGPTPDPNLGTPGGHLYCDVAVGSDGRLAAALSSVDAGNTNGNPGIFVSFDDGDSWDEITSSIQNFPQNYQRSVIGFAPSAPDTLYILTYAGGNGSNEDVRLHFVDLNNFDSGGSIVSEDRSGNIPDFGGDVGYMSTQANYNMEVAVKPDDPDLVLLGGTNLFRSSDGFATPPTDSDGDGFTDDSEKDSYWVGGYAKSNDRSIYPNQHPDQHVVAFDPVDPTQAWVGHDGGLSRSSDITAGSVSWSDRDNGYVTSQYYAIDIPEDPSDPRLVGGTQDNGSPYFKYDSQAGMQTQNSVNAFTGDGGYAFFTNSYMFVSAQNGIVLRWTTDNQTGDPVSGSYSYVYPSQARGQMFIQPYAIDPNNQNIMYYPGGDSLWRNTRISDIQSQNSPDGTTQGWSVVTQVGPSSEYMITALEVSRTPSDVLYYGAYSFSGAPRLFKLIDASSSNTPEEISISGAQTGSYPHDIAVNPANGNELLVVFSNYNVPSVFYSADGGNSWQDIEGNLNAVNPNAGPSVRSATIIPGEGGTIYLLGTSTGVYSTTGINGNNTQWVQEAPNSLGYAVTEYITSRSSDGTVAAGTHGRGIFKGDFEGTVTNTPSITFEPVEARAGEKIALTAINFSFSPNAAENEVLFNETPAVVENATASELTVVVPRLPLAVEASENPGTPVSSVQIRVVSGGQTVIAPTSFTLLPPNQFALRQNFPNPFNPSTTIPFDVPERRGIVIQIFDINGREIRPRPLNGKIYDEGTYNVRVNLNGLASGVYFYRILALPLEGQKGKPLIKTRKMTLIK